MNSWTTASASPPRSPPRSASPGPPRRRTRRTTWRSATACRSPATTTAPPGPGTTCAGTSTIDYQGNAWSWCPPAPAHARVPDLPTARAHGLARGARPRPAGLSPGAGAPRDAAPGPPPGGSMPMPLPAAPGLGFKPEHFAAIHETGPRSASSRSMPRTTWARAGRRTRSSPRSAPTTRSRCTASACRIGGPGPLDRDHLARLRAPLRPLRARELLRAPRLVEPRRAPTSTTCCRCPTRRRRWPRVCAHVDEAQEALGRPMLLENPSTYVALRAVHDPRDRVPARGRRPHRLRAAARRQQRLRLGHQPPHRPARLPGRLPARPGGRDPPRRLRRGGAALGAAPDRRPRHARRRPGLGPLRGGDRARRAAAHADRVGQRRAAPSRRSWPRPSGRGASSTGRALPSHPEPLEAFRAGLAGPTPPGLTAVGDRSGASPSTATTWPTPARGAGRRFPVVERLVGPSPLPPWPASSPRRIARRPVLLAGARRSPTFCGLPAARAPALPARRRPDRAGAGAPSTPPTQSARPPALAPRQSQSRTRCACRSIRRSGW